ncbi:hypothetical protein ACFXKF_36290 [Streptomyces scopuliridis]|uniref:hypothetical protein n=1 Tax=Streptomyces scopuliridis TaxID=452529 RepID=UPI0036CF220C
MARRTEYDAQQAAGRLKVPIAAFRWARHAGVIPPPDAGDRRWIRATVEAMDPGTIQASLPNGTISGGQAADRIAEALGTPNTPGETPVVGTFTIRRLIARGLLVDLTTNDDYELVNPEQVTEVCARPDLSQMTADDAPLGPTQAAEHLGVRRVDFDHMHLRLGWVAPAEWREARYGTSRAGAVQVPIFRTADIDALPHARTEVDWAELRAVGKGQRSPLLGLVKAAASA